MCRARRGDEAASEPTLKEVVLVVVHEVAVVPPDLVGVGAADEIDDLPLPSTSLGGEALEPRVQPGGLAAEGVVIRERRRENRSLVVAALLE